MTGSWLGRIEGLSLFVGNKEVISYINCLTHAMYAKIFMLHDELCRHWRFEVVPRHITSFLKTILLLLVYVIHLVAGTCLSWLAQIYT